MSVEQISTKTVFRILYAIVCYVENHSKVYYASCFGFPFFLSFLNVLAQNNSFSSGTIETIVRTKRRHKLSTPLFHCQTISTCFLFSSVVLIGYTITA